MKGIRPYVSIIHAVPRGGTRIAIHSQPSTRVLGSTHNVLTDSTASHSHFATLSTRTRLRMIVVAQSIQSPRIKEPGELIVKCVFLGWYTRRIEASCAYQP